jgi:hypothetical protein
VKTFLVTAAIIFVACTSAFAEDLHYGFPCGIAMDSDIASATSRAAKNLTQTTEDYKTKLAKENYEIVSVSSPAASIDKANNMTTLCSTVTFKAKQSNKEVSSLSGSGIR